ncbi:hypothetical protein CPLU01_08366 [Colletotrichum plurivorum]|uniref:Uncharacterized protein n=1 Tax=Colletotrichum plurivorum TaxID=2175906 RepID=A0A8H6KC28_9PEZI|nr:hypothetical protein CPLU01_08366 [Colletotrichum plurivorum]
MTGPAPGQATLRQTWIPPDDDETNPTCLALPRHTVPTGYSSSPRLPKTDTMDDSLSRFLQLARARLRHISPGPLVPTTFAPLSTAEAESRLLLFGWSSMTPGLGDADGGVGGRFDLSHVTGKDAPLPHWLLLGFIGGASCTCSSQPRSMDNERQRQSSDAAFTARTRTTRIGRRLVSSPPLQVACLRRMTHPSPGIVFPPRSAKHHTSSLTPGFVVNETPSLLRMATADRAPSQIACACHLTSGGQADMLRTLLHATCHGLTFHVGPYYVTRPYNIGQISHMIRLLAAAWPSCQRSSEPIGSFLFSISYGQDPLRLAAVLDTPRLHPGPQAHQVDSAHGLTDCLGQVVEGEPCPEASAWEQASFDEAVFSMCSRLGSFLPSPSPDTEMERCHAALLRERGDHLGRRWRLDEDIRHGRQMQRDQPKSEDFGGTSFRKHKTVNSTYLRIGLDIDNSIEPGRLGRFAPVDDELNCDTRGRRHPTHLDEAPRLHPAAEWPRSEQR